MALGVLVGFAGPASAAALLFDFSTPVDDAANVAITTDVTLAFSQPIDGTTSDTTRVYLKDVLTDTLVASSVTITVEGDVLIEPTADLANGTDYYVTWDGDALTDGVGNFAAAVTDETTLNFSTVAEDTIAPSFVSAETTTDGLVIVLDYDETLDGTSTPVAADFTVSGDTARTVTGVEISGDTVRLTLDVAIAFGEVVTVSYISDPTLATQDSSGNDAANLTDGAVTNNVPDPTPADTIAPSFVSAETTTDGLVIVLDYDETLDGTSTPVAADFTVSGDTARTVTGVEISGDTVRLTLDVAIAFGEVVTVSYISDPTLATQDSSGNDAANLTDGAVTNNVPDPTPADTIAPTITGSTTVSRTAPTTEVATYTADEAITSWSISGDTDRIEVTSAGVVRFKAASTVGTYNITVEATDAAGNKGTLNVTVTVAAAPDTTAPVVSGSAAVSKTAPTTTVATYTSEEDVTWSLSGTNSGLFNIVGGVVTFKTASVAGTYNINVEATDEATNKGTLAVTVTVAAAPTGGGSGGGGLITETPTQVPPTASTAKKVMIPGFAANSAMLTKEMKKEIREFLKANPTLKNVVCKGFTSSPATAQDRVLARQRGKAACDFIKTIRPDAQVTIRSGSHTNKPGSQIRRVSISLS